VAIAMIGEPAAERGSENGSESPGGREKTLILAALGRRENVADDGERQAHHHASSDALQSSKNDELVHAVDG
jgi:hypothetical protein